MRPCGTPSSASPQTRRPTRRSPCSAAPPAASIAWIKDVCCRLNARYGSNEQRARCAPSPRLRGEGRGEGLPQRARHVENPPPPPASRGHPPPPSGGGGSAPHRRAQNPQNLDQ